ncbi:glutathione peroxidase [Puteibacter caeruleilacunae]|nr:glutathione peroxidase [Puteibacter caeruleilacunae]
MKTVLKPIQLIIILTSLICISFQSVGQENSIYQFTVQDIEGNEFPLSKLKGKKVMIVNTASKCGLTPQYEQLQELFTKYKAHNFIIIGFPANNFMKQEPGSNAEISSFCQKNYGVTFPMMSKISVKGDDIHPLYKWLTKKEYNKLQDAPVKWNFQKYLIDETGKLEKVIAPRIKPNADEIVNWIIQ